MANVFLDNPPVLQGTPDTKLAQLYSYLYNVSTQLNSTLMTMEMKRENTEKLVIEKTQKAEEQTADSDFLKAKSLIIKTAQLVRTEMEEIRASLSGNIEAISELFGTYQESITQQITATATGILQEFHIEERISGVEGEVQDFVRNQESYIFAGILDSTTNTAGIAIGEDVTDENGNLVLGKRVVQITSGRISFFQGGAEVAYFSNNNFYIAKGIVTDGMQMGNFEWKVFSNNSLGLMKI